MSRRCRLAREMTTTRREVKADPRHVMRPGSAIRTEMGRRTSSLLYHLISYEHLVRQHNALFFSVLYWKFPVPCCADLVCFGPKNRAVVCAARTQQTGERLNRLTTTSFDTRTTTMPQGPRQRRASNLPLRPLCLLAPAGPCATPTQLADPWGLVAVAGLLRHL